MNLVDNFLDKMNALPMLPKVVQQVMNLLNQEDINMVAVVDKINHDQVLAARVLRMSNSAHFGCSRSIKTTQDAIAMIGLENVKTLVVACGVTAAFKEVPGLDLKRFWRHSLITASVARQLSKDLGFDAEVAYLGGLMHTVGQLPIHLIFPGLASQVEEACHGKSVLERRAVERSILPIDHCAAGEMLAKFWNFPEEIVRVIRYYAEPFHPQACEMAPVIYAASHIAFDIEQGVEARHIIETLNTDVAKKLTLTDVDYWAEKIEGYRQFVEEAKTYL